MPRHLLATSAILLALSVAPALAQEAGPQAPSDQSVLGPPVDLRSLEPVPPRPLIDDTAPEAEGEASARLAEAEPTEPYDPRPAPRDAQGRSVYGLFLAGKVASAIGDPGVGAEYLADAYELSPEQGRLRDRAFISSLLVGDLDLAARIPPEADGSPVTVEAAHLVRAVRGAFGGDARRANAALKARPIAQPHAYAGRIIAPWVAAAAGDWTTALQPLATEGDAASVAFGRYFRARLLELRGRPDEALEELRAVSLDGAGGRVFRVAVGELLERDGRRDEALALYNELIAADPNNFRAIAGKARIEAGERPPPAPTLRENAAEALASAAALAARERLNEFAVLYLRLSLGVSPSDETRLVLAQALQAARLEEAARAEYARVSTENPQMYAEARQRLAASYQEADRPDQALAEARRAFEVDPTNAAAAYNLAAVFTEQERYAEALEILDGPTLNTARQPWPVRFQRGAVYESMGRNDQAEAELWAALQSEPNDPQILNYLGYMWVDHGTRVDQGAEMIARAVDAEPTSGHYQDSLGWARYRQGRFEEAVPILELAVSLEPANAEINDHLGDAYWQVGREREARFQWERVLALDPDDDRRAEVERKLSEGLDPAAPTTVAAATPPVT
ncbi:tetratricopeptide repeat protein [Brevundimonas sp.]|uniref:tetratricopeptide repeat protein n=1 Tax=Brevundimonas sp. TaxID=1871086 RepID=UPI0035B26E87